MVKIYQYLFAGILVSAILLQLSFWGLLQTGNLLYLVSSVCSLSALIWVIYHLVKSSALKNSSRSEIHLVILQADPDAPDSLFEKVRERM